MTMTWAKIEERLDDYPTQVARAQELLSFAFAVLSDDCEGQSIWVVRMAIERAVKTIVEVVDEYSSPAETARIEATVVLGLGLAGVREAFECDSTSDVGRPGSNDANFRAGDLVWHGIACARNKLERIEGKLSLFAKP